MSKNLLKKFATRIRNPKILTSIVSGLLLVLVNIGAITVSTQHHVMDAINTVLGLLVGMGVFANPESHIKSVQDVQQPTQPVNPPTSTEQQSK